MKKLYRRSFVKQLFSGVAGTVLLSSYKSTDSNYQVELLDSKDDSETFWGNVKSQFKFAPNLRYFNNGSLGSCPLVVQKATNNFRATLDAFPSKYMWGGWNDEKENVRQKVADLFSVSKEEIAFTHNTTEGMNLIARSFNLDVGDEVILVDHDKKLKETGFIFDILLSIMFIFAASKTQQNTFVQESRATSSSHH